MNWKKPAGDCVSARKKCKIFIDNCLIQSHYTDIEQGSKAYFSLTPDPDRTWVEYLWRLNGEDKNDGLDSATNSVIFIYPPVERIRGDKSVFRCAWLLNVGIMVLLWKYAKWSKIKIIGADQVITCSTALSFKALGVIYAMQMPVDNYLGFILFDELSKGAFSQAAVYRWIMHSDDQHAIAVG